MTHSLRLPRLSALLLLAALAVLALLAVRAAPPASASDEPPDGPEPWNIQVVPGDGTLTVTWNISSRSGFEDSEIWHVLRWSQEFGVWANPRDPRGVGPNDGVSVDPGVTTYVITGLENGVATGVFVRSMTGHRDNMSERDGNSSEWVRTKGVHTTPVAPPNEVPTVSSAIADATIASEDGTHEASLTGVFDDADGDSLTVTATSSDKRIARVSVSADYSSLRVKARRPGTATVTVTAADGNGGSVSDEFTVTVLGSGQGQQAVELPGPVTGLDLTVTAEDRLKVSWSAPESGGAPRGYIVHLRPEDGKQASGTTKRPGPDRTTVSFNNLEPGRTYEVWVRAQNDAGKGERAAATIALPAVLPGPVAGLELAAAEESVTVIWSAPESGGAPDGYIVHLRPEDGGPGSGRTKTPKAKKTKVTFENLEPGRTYEVWVRAQNQAGKGERVRASVTVPEAELKRTPPPGGTPPTDGTPSTDDTPPTDDGGAQEQGEDQVQERPAEPALVTNFGQERRRTDWSTNNFVLAQGFTTGHAATTLESIEVSIRETLNVSHIATVRAELWSTAEGGGPGDKLVDLVVPDSMAKGDVAFSAPAGTTLPADTTYHFVLYTTGRVDLRVVATYSEDEDDVSEDGWSIADASHHVEAQTPEGGDWVEVTVSGVMLMRVKGLVPGDQPGQ